MIDLRGIRDDFMAAEAAEEAKVKIDEPQKAQTKRPSRAAKKKKNEKVVFKKSKRKNCIARGSGKPGSGIIRVNGERIDIIEPHELREEMLKPVYISDINRSVANGIDMDINVYGGGVSSRAQAVAGVIARIISDFAQSDTVRKEIIRYDRTLLIDDPRRVEPKKFLGTKARARFQTSYR